MQRLGKWTKLWIAWLVAFVLIEVFAARSHDPRPRTLTEFLRKLFPRKWRRLLLIGLMALLTWHFWQDPKPKPPHEEVELPF